MKCRLERVHYFHNKNIDANVAFLFNFAKTFFIYRKFNSIIIKIISQFFIFLRNYFWMYFYRVSMSNVISKKTFLIVIFGVD